MKLKYVKEYRDSTGTVRRYFRKAGRPDVALPGDPASVEFMQAYRQALKRTFRKRLGARHVMPAVREQTAREMRTSGV